MSVLIAQSMRGGADPLVPEVEEYLEGLSHRFTQSLLRIDDLYRSLERARSRARRDRVAAELSLEVDRNLALKAQIDGVREAIRVARHGGGGRGRRTRRRRR